jgi:hypothetical protein
MPSPFVVKVAEKIGPGPGMWLPYGCSIAIGLFAPADVLNRFPFLVPFTDVMASIVPSISARAAQSRIPEVTTLLFSFAWLAMPLQTWAAFAYAMKTRTLVNHWKSSAMLKYAGVPLVIVIVGVMSWVVFMFALEGPDCMFSCMSRSRFVLGFIGGLLPFAPGFTLVMIYIWIANFPEIYLSGRKEG